jgi:predicted DNA-binding protein (UPF0278 family)
LKAEIERINEKVKKEMRRSEETITELTSQIHTLTSEKEESISDNK